MSSLAAVMGELHYATRHSGMRAGLWVLAAACGALGLIAVFLWWPAQHAHEEALARVESLRREIVLARQSGEIARAFEKARASIPLIRKKLESSTGQAQLVDSLGQLARRSGLQLLSESYEDGRINGMYQPLVIDIAVKGTYGSLRTFLAGLPALPLWGELQEIKLERAREGNALKGQLRLVLFRRSSAPTAGTSPS